MRGVYIQCTITPTVCLIQLKGLPIQSAPWVENNRELTIGC